MFAVVRRAIAIGASVVVPLQGTGHSDSVTQDQHWLPPLQIADLVRDTDVLDEARRDALELAAASEGLRRPEFSRLRQMVLGRYGRAWELAEVG